MLSHRERRTIRHVSATLLFIVASSAGARAQQLRPLAVHPCARAEPQNVVLTVQGGGSLGVYEGGMTWAFVQMFKRRTALQEDSLFHGQPGDSVLACLPWFRLAAATGASAGSINAFLAATDWCDRRLETRPDSSPFWLAWVNTGIEQLFPRSDAGRGEKGVFAREHFRTNILSALVDGYWRGSRWNHDCTVAFGAAITRLRADSFPIGAIYARTQRFASTFDVTGRARDSEPPILLARNADVGKPDMGSVVTLHGGDTISINRAFDLLEASSGYPLAFATKALDICKTTLGRCTPCDNTAQGAQQPGCAERIEFLDGGVFDNSPLALAFALAKELKMPPIAVYLAPENRRHQGFGAVATAVTPVSPKRGTKRDSVVSDGLNELLVLAPELVSTARAYELQIASRLLPSGQRELAFERQKDRLRGQLAEASTRELREHRRADSLELRNDSLERMSRNSNLAIAYLESRVDSLRHELDGTAGRGRPDASASMPNVSETRVDSAGHWRWRLAGVRTAASGGEVELIPRLNPTVVRVTQAGAPQPSPMPIVSEPRNDEIDTALVPIIRETGRYHPIAGAWLAGFGGFLGRPLRAYDFYVGAYDAFMVVVRNTRCSGVAPEELQRCVRREARDLFRARVVALGPVGERMMNKLYQSEFGDSVVWSDAELTRITPADSTKFLVLEGVQRAMLTRAEDTCDERTIIAAQMCRDRMTAVFDSLRQNTTAMAILRKEAKKPACDTRGELSVSVQCGVERRFLKLVEDPEGGFDVLVREVLARLEVTTPRGGMGAKATDVISLLYYSTNDRDRRGLDMGAVSLPSYLDWKWRPVWLLPSSVSYTRKAGAVDLGWEARQHIGTYPFAVALPIRLDFSHLGEVGRQGNPTRVILGGRVDLKNCLPNCFPKWLPFVDRLPSAFVSRIGYEWDFWWRYTSTHPWTQSGQWPYTGMSHGVSVLLLGGKIEASVMTVPKWLHANNLNSSMIGRKPVFVRIGAADVNGMLYWLTRTMLM